MNTQHGEALLIRKEIEGKFIMQVKREFAEKVRSIAPKELRSPVLRTLAMIAYHQPITVADLWTGGCSDIRPCEELEEKRLRIGCTAGKDALLADHAEVRAEYFILNPATGSDKTKDNRTCQGAEKWGLTSGSGSRE